MRNKDADLFVTLTQSAVAHAVQTGQVMPVPEGLPQELLTRRAGVFVSLHIGDALRGCIGTISPTQPTLAEEITHNAFSAALQDPRFDPVTLEEFSRLRIGVDVLEEPEDIDSADALNPKIYGVIVSRGTRRGLLLPDLPGVDTVGEQIDIARRKAGIPPGTEVRLQRFRVTRHE